MISVILYHMSEVLVPSGFIGVDVFFVISGFVVTNSVLQAETADTLRNVLSFWRRRWLRILPVLLVFVFVTTILAAGFLAPIPIESYRGAFRTGGAALAGVGNLYLNRIALDYFQADQSINVFSHTWSLGVEEQFYFFFSLLFIAGTAALSAQTSRRLARIMLLLVVGVASIAWFFESAARNPVSTYYSLVPRLWELASGSLLAFVTPRPQQSRSRVTDAFSLIAAIGLFVAMFSVPALAEFPVVQIVVGVLATGVLLASGASSLNYVPRILGARVLVFLGLISYSLYLWHWPVLVIFRYSVGLQAFWTRLAALLVAFLLALWSHRFVEQRWRRSREPFVRRLLPKFLAAFTIVMATVFGVQRYPGALYLGHAQNWTRDWMPATGFSYAAANRIRQFQCLIHEGSVVPASIPEACTTIAPPHGIIGPKRLVLVGDSHAFADWSMAAYGADRGEYRLETFVHDGCSAASPESGRSESCRAYWTWVNSTVARDLRPGDAVFVSFLWPLYGGVSLQPATNELTRIAQAAARVGARVIVQAPLPYFDRPSYMCTPEWFRTDYDGCATGRENFEQRRLDVMKLIDAIRKAQSNVSIWDPGALLCSVVCLQFRNGKPLFREGGHLSYFGGRSLGPAFATFVLSSAH